MRRLQQKRTRAAWILLMVFVPMLITASLHHHTVEENDIECYACAHHIHHAGHITESTVSIDNCILCTFLTTPVLPAVTLVLTILITKVDCWTGSNVTLVTADTKDLPMMRAPPFIID